MYSNRKYGKVPTRSEQIAQLRNSGETPLFITRTVFGLEPTREQYDFTIAVLAKHGVIVNPDYAEELWEGRK